MKDLNTYLHDAGIDPDQTAVCFHKPVERAFARFLPYIAAHEPELLEAYQCSHSDRASQTLSERRHMVSFVRLCTGEMVFFGLFEVKGFSQRPVSEICAIPEVQRLYADYGVGEEFFDGFSQSWLWFDLQRETTMSDYVGRLQVAQPAFHDYMQAADRLTAPIIAMAETSVLNVPMPEWDNLVLVTREVMMLPPALAANLAEWDGIYLITDEHGGARYVGATRAGQGFLSCWRDHITGKTAGVERLARRNPAHFRFSILERLAAGVGPEQFAARKASWIARLGTADFGLNDRS